VPEYTVGRIAIKHYCLFINAHVKFHPGRRTGLPPNRVAEAGWVTAGSAFLGNYVY